MRAYALRDVSNCFCTKLIDDLLGNDFEVCVDLTTVLDGLLACFNAALVVALLKLGSAQVCHVGNVPVCFPCLCVVFDRLIKLALLVELCTLLLQLIGLDLGLLSCLLLLCLLNLGLGLGLGLRFLPGLCGCRSCIGHLNVFLRLGSTSASTTLLSRSTKLHVNAQQHAHNLQETGILHKLAHPVGIALQLLQLLHEGRVCEERGRLGVAGQLLDHVGVVEHATEPS
ncbi:hypothetical protein BU25DRAFT_212854 [Macroventuria anomochaeta]|uniref:Uncharacterized protein n=1 Tax=Macroventuria anomochaeta TaxID=301207 RepID=A0ACB6RM81_9PLEO|nr:uncharacterized protein BU25DRAFT_212854 [Macroventuria anomochaeta]KAF2622437.1 hypothetical protein BU25DRAFT_212854 [Macroventuria anomochaeta]